MIVVIVVHASDVGSFLIGLETRIVIHSHTEALSSTVLQLQRACVIVVRMAEVTHEAFEPYLKFIMRTSRAYHRV